MILLDRGFLLWRWACTKICFFFFQIATRKNDLGKFDCNYYINNYRFWWSSICIPQYHYLVYFSLWKCFSSSISGRQFTELKCVLKSHSSVIFYAVAIKKLRRIIEQLLHEMLFSICSPRKSEYFSLCFLSYVIYGTFLSAIPKTVVIFWPNNR